MGWAARANAAERAAAKKAHRKRRVTLSVGTPNPPRRWRQWHDTGTVRVMRRGISGLFR